MMIHSLCENYGWSYNEAMRLTMPQMILMSHASSVAYKRATSKSDTKKKNNSLSADSITVRGKKLSELNSDELATYYLTSNDEHGFGDVNIIYGG